MAMRQAAADPEEVRRILRLMESDSAIRDEVRRAILTGELLELPQRLSAYVETTDRRLEAVERRLDAIDVDLAELKQALAAFVEATDRHFASVDADLAELKQALAAFIEATDRHFATVDFDLAELKQALASFIEATDRHSASVDADLGGLKGDAYERRVRERAPAILSRIAGGLRRLRVLSTSELADQLDEAVDAGRITESGREEVLRADAVARSISRVSGQPVHVIVEASVTLGGEDVRRSLLRRDLTAQAFGGEAVAVVVSSQVPDDISTHDVEVVRFA